MLSGSGSIAAMGSDLVFQHRGQISNFYWGQISNFDFGQSTKSAPR
jgi:hypothetical protein